MPRVVVSWSGGKDSCLACYKAMLSGFEVAYLLNFVFKDGRCAFHGLDPDLIVAQSQAMEIPVIQREVTWNTYEDTFKATLAELRKNDVEYAVFGDIHIREHLDWVKRVCSKARITPLEPLWGMNPEQVLKEFIDAGFDAVVINANADLFEEGFLGRRVNTNFLEDLKNLRRKYEFDLCGEYGEYHTFVVDGPIFKRRIKILESKKVLKDGYWKYWFLDILRWRVEEKG